MSVIACILLTVSLLSFIFWPEQNPFVQADKTRLDYLRERKDSIYENLRDLSIQRATTPNSGARSKTRLHRCSPRWTGSRRAECAANAWMFETYDTPKGHLTCTLLQLA